MAVTIWHNPRCSKSRQTLALLEERDVDVDIRPYLQNAPSEDEIRAALAALGISAHALVRKGEKAFKEAGLSKDSSETEVIDAMLQHPILIERPIVFAGKRAAIGRPPEAVLDLI